jgi:hypothetical protein
VTRDSALARTRKLLALAARGSGASEDEARNAAVAAARLVLEHGLLDDRGQSPSPIDLDQVASLSFRVLELEHLVSTERTAHAAEIRRRDEQWRGIVERIRKEERAAARRDSKRAVRKAVVKDRTAQARAGGKGRDRALTHDQKVQIGRQGAQERWRRWRERQQG